MAVFVDGNVAIVTHADISEICNVSERKNPDETLIFISFGIDLMDLFERKTVGFIGIDGGDDASVDGKKVRNESYVDFLTCKAGESLFDLGGMTVLTYIIRRERLVALGIVSFLSEAFACTRNTAL